MPRFGNRNCSTTILVALSVITIGARSIRGDGPIDPARDAIVQRLAQQERLVKSCECLLTYRTDVADPKMVPLIQAQCRKLGARPSQYLITKEVAALNSFVAHWWRRGIKERCDEYRSFEDMAKPGTIPTRSDAYDGTVARSYNQSRIHSASSARLEGSIRRSDRWLAENQAYPFAFVFEFMHVPYSELIRLSTDVKITETAGRTTVALTHPTFKQRRFVLVFDRDGSLRQRDVITKRARDLAPGIERHSFSAYRQYRNAFGETVSFPSQADYDYTLGMADDGQLIVYQHVHIDVNSFQFNQQITDETFVIQFPEGCNVVDRVFRAPPQ
jgi:hypothetical protein